VHPFGLTTDELSDGVVRIAVAGELDYGRAYLFDAELRAVEERAPSTIVLDLRLLHFLDSTGLSRILAAHRRAGRDGRQLVVVRGGRAVQRLFAMTAMDDHLKMVSDPQAALAQA
jgi:anti-sigma B factor antagonist